MLPHSISTGGACVQYFIVGVRVLALTCAFTSYFIDVSFQMSTDCQNSAEFRHQNHLEITDKKDDTVENMELHIPVCMWFISGLCVAFLLACWPPFSNHFFRPHLTQKSYLPSAYYPRSQSESQIGITYNRKPSERIDLRNEAVSSMHLAISMQQKGKLEKASKLFRHAYALDPSQADVAYEYGQHIEKHSEDIIFAEHLYTKALVLNPDHKRALIRQQSISPLVRELDERALIRIDKKRDELYNIPDHHPGLRRIKHESYMMHIYHTVAIEGNTMSYSEARAVIETKLAIAGKTIMEHNEFLGVEMALRYVNSTLLQKFGRIELDDILEIHRRVLGPVDPVEAGRLRKTQVFIAEHRPPPPDRLDDYMREFVYWMNSPNTLRLHPIEFAALAHYKLVVIHPFYDGNGRTSRLLMNLILMQSGYPPVTIRVDEKHIYFQHIVTANEGDVRPFIRFIAEATERTLDQFLLCSSADTHDLVLSDRHNIEAPGGTDWIIKGG